MSLRGSVLGLLSAGATLWGYTLDARFSSAQVHVGEAVALDYIFERGRGDEGIDFRFAAPELAHFRVLQSRSDEHNGPDRKRWTKQYIVVPMQSGALRTGAAAMNIAERLYEKDEWGQWMPSVKWKPHRFDSVSLYANPVPTGIGGVGRFEIRAVTDRNETEQGRPVRLTLTLFGCGSLDDVELLPPPIRGVSLFPESKQLNAVWEEGCYRSELNQSVSLVGETDFTIPSVIFRSFDPKQGAVVMRQTLPIDIHVRAGTEPKVPVITDEEERMTVLSVAAGAAAGFGLGVAATLLFSGRRKREQGARFDSLRAALVELFMHLDDPEAKQAAEAVEKHLYEGAAAPSAATLSTLLARLKRLPGTKGH